MKLYAVENFETVLYVARTRAICIEYMANNQEDTLDADIATIESDHAAYNLYHALMVQHEITEALMERRTSKYNVLNLCAGCRGTGSLAVHVVDNEGSTVLLCPDCEASYVR